MYILAPSLLAADFGNLKKDVEEVTRAGASYLHLDVMDGRFVPSISFGMPVIQCVRQFTDAFLDVHLMIEEPGRYITEFKECGADSITVHAEACCHLDRTIDGIKQLGIKAGVALNPATPLSVLEYILDKVDMVLIMSVNPGFGGQKYIPYISNKITSLRNMVRERGLAVDIQVDGGVNVQNAEAILRAGANILVAGSAVFSGNKEKNVEQFLEVFKRAGL